jgi:cytochrome c peroxidase
MGGELLDQARLMFQPIPATPPALDRGPTAAQKVALGKMLFFEPRLSQSHNIACSSCHNLGLGGGDALETSLGHRSQHGGRNAPTVLNAPFNTAQFWDGRAKDLQEQAGGPLVNPIEMAMTPAHVLEQLGGIPGYVQAFHAAFPGTTEPVTLTNVAQSIAAFEATLITPNAPFDRYLRGDAMALSPEQQAGLRLFMEDG